MSIPIAISIKISLRKYWRKSFRTERRAFEVPAKLYHYATKTPKGSSIRKDW